MNYDFKTFFKEGYGKRPLPDGKGYIEIVPTTQKFFEKDGSDVRLDRVYVYDSNGKLIRTYLQDKMGQCFVDNQPDVKDDFSYLGVLPSREKQNKTRFQESPENKSFL